MDLKTQNMIVKQRLQYHFASPSNGGWNIPENMPFMKEFLNEIEKLTELCDSQKAYTDSGQSNIPDVIKSGCEHENMERISENYFQCARCGVVKGFGQPDL